MGVKRKILSDCKGLRKLSQVFEVCSQKLKVNAKRSGDEINIESWTFTAVI